jgi:hypothetical protein
MASVAQKALMAALLAGASLLSGCSAFEAASLEPETVFATTQSNRLVRFSAGAPARLAGGRAISGMHPGEQVVGLDFRPADGRLERRAAAGRFGEAVLGGHAREGRGEAEALVQAEFLAFSQASKVGVIVGMKILPDWISWMLFSDVMIMM